MNFQTAVDHLEKELLSQSLDMLVSDEFDVEDFLKTMDTIESNLKRIYDKKGKPIKDK